MSVFEILECGLYHEKKRYICMSKCVRNVLKTRRYDSVLSPIFFFSLILLKPPLNSCGLSQLNVQRVRYLPSREPGTCILCHSIYVQVTDLNYSISRVSYVLSSRTTDESLLQKSKRFRSLCRLRIPVNIVPRTHISYDQIFFAKINTKL